MKVRRIVKQEVDIPGLGHQIKKAREADHRSVIELAKTVGISRSYWYQLESEEASGGVAAEDTVKIIEKVLKADFGIDFNNLETTPPCFAEEGVYELPQLS